MLLYLAGWILAGANHQDSSVTGVVTLGGDENPASKLLPLQKLHQSTSGDLLLGFSWYLTVPFLLILPVIVMVSISEFLKALCLGRPRPYFGRSHFPNYFAWLTFVLVCVGGSLSVAAAVLN